jgi:hypothetical protein
MAIGFPVKANYATGDILTATNMNDMAGTLNTVPALISASGSSNVAGKNVIINSNYSVWQRGTSIAGSGSTYNYTADRWQTEASASLTISRQATGDTTNLPNIQYCARAQRNNASTATNIPMLAQSIETVNSIPLAGKTVTLSFYARKGANFSATSNLLNAYLSSGTGTDQNVWVGGFTGAVNLIAQTPTLTSTWQRFSYSATVGATATQLGIEFYYTPTGTAGAADYYEITGVQLEIASSASAYSPNATTQQGELAACQRYYYRTGAASNDPLSVGAFATSTICNGITTFPVAMRTSPTALEQSGTAADYRLLFNNGNATCSAVPNFAQASQYMARIAFTIASGGTQGYGATFASNATTGYLAWSAEL